MCCHNHLITVFCNSIKLGLICGLFACWKALVSAFSLQLTSTAIQAFWSASSSAWKWYGLLSMVRKRHTLTTISRETTNLYLQLIKSKPRLSSGTGLIWHVSRLTRVGGFVSSAWQMSKKPSAVTRHRRFCHTRRTLPSLFFSRWPVRVIPWFLSPCSWCNEYPAPLSVVMFCIIIKFFFIII